MASVYSYKRQKVPLVWSSRSFPVSHWVRDRGDGRKMSSTTSLPTRSRDPRVRSPTYGPTAISRATS